MGFTDTGILLGFGIALGAIVVFLLLREFWCWYWKINDIRALLSRIERLLLKQGGGEALSESKESPADAITSGYPEVCPNCGQRTPKYPGMIDEIRCAKCGHKFKEA